MKRTIFDLDNCLADDRHRIPKIDWSRAADAGRWDAYHEGAEADNAWQASLVAHSINPVFFTARPERFRATTEAWIRRHYGIASPEVYMRGDSDHRPSVRLKADMLANLLTFGDCDEVVKAYDDREDIVEMYRGFDIEAERLWIHDVCAYTPPKPSADSVEKTLREFLSFHIAANPRAPELLDAGAKTFRERNAIYGDTYLKFGEACAALFPEGLTIEAGDVEGFNRLGVYVQCLGKLARYAGNLSEGGHQDSAHDLMVYAAMLEEVTKR